MFIAGLLSIIYPEKKTQESTKSPELPPELIEMIFLNLPLSDIATCSTLCKKFQPIASYAFNKKLIEESIFGKQKWEKYLGKVGEEPDLPKNIVDILKAPCPFWEKKRICQTHQLIMIPKSVNGKPFTIKRIQEIIQKPKIGAPSKIKYIPETLLKGVTKKPIKNSYWILITKDVLPNSREKSYEEQIKMVSTHKRYRAVKLIELISTIYAVFYNSGVAQTRLFSTTLTSCTFTICQERISWNYGIIVGGFYYKSLSVIVEDAKSENVGIAALMQLPITS